MCTCTAIINIGIDVDMLMSNQPDKQGSEEHRRFDVVKGK
jgi:hypothetical protein